MPLHAVLASVSFILQILSPKVSFGNPQCYHGCLCMANILTVKDTTVFTLAVIMEMAF